eukprot:768143-Hanusia_phi.AAC.4
MVDKDTDNKEEANWNWDGEATWRRHVALFPRRREHVVTSHRCHQGISTSPAHCGLHPGRPARHVGEGEGVQ